MRKINAGISLFTTIFLLSHAIFLSIWMLSRGSIARFASFAPWILMGATVVHALISIDLAVTGIMESISHKSKSYPRMNISTIIQRASSVLMILLVGLHITGAASGYQPKMLHAVAHPLFFAAALVHSAVSTSKALITLGIGSAKFIRIADIAIKVICGATLIAGTIGFYLCLFMGVVK